MLKTRLAYPHGLARRVYFAQSLIFRQNSAEITRSRENLGNKSYEFVPMATQTQLTCI